jgi:hypothetical protein
MGMIGSEWSSPRQEIKLTVTSAAPAVSGEGFGDSITAMKSLVIKSPKLL